MAKSLAGALLCATALTGFLAPQAAAAQDSPATPQTADDQATADDSGGPIIVTARRRDESIVDVPLAITVVSSEKMSRLNLTSTKDIANFTPSLEFSDFTQGNSRNDRGANRTIIFRGLNLANNGGSTTQAASMFLDGAAVISNEIPGSLDIGAVEVLRGPQNVYFGRATMTGAISYRTKAIPDRITVDANATVAERQTYKVEASVAGPIIGDTLGARVTGLYETNDGYITNAYNPSGKKLGARERRSISGTVNFKPVDTMEFKAYVNYFQDDDNPSATVNIFPDALYAPGGTAANPNPNLQGAFVSTGVVTNCLKGITNVLAGSPPGTAPTLARGTLCGRVPDRSHAIAYSRTDIPAEYQAVLFDLNPFIKAENFDRTAGSHRNGFNSHLVANFQISDYLKFQSITGYHNNTTLVAVDGAQQPITPQSQFSILFFGLTSRFKDLSQEIRLSSDPERAFSWTVGANYIDARVLSEAFNLTTTNIQPTAQNPNPVQTFNGASGAFNVGFNRGETFGYFAGGYLKLLDNRLTLSAEGRYQSDRRTARTLKPSDLTTIASSGLFAKTFTAFYPRVSVDYDVGGGRKVYASYAKGGRPGGFNSALLSFLDPANSRYATCGCFAATVSQIQSLFGVTDSSFKQESLTIGELGFKGYLDNNKGYFDLNLYYGNVSNQQVTQAQLITALTPPTTLSIITNTGKTRIYGIEFTGNYRFTPDISLDVTGAYNYTKRITFLDPSPATIAQFGISDFSGKKLNLAPIYSGSAVLSYEQRTSDSWTPFGNIAAVYRGKQYADIANYSYIPGRTVVDLRAGVKNEMFRIEAFVTNLFDNRTYPAGNVAADFGINKVGGVRSSNSGFFGAYAEPRTFGARASVHF